jgi:shikimate dehydrogenase
MNIEAASRVVRAGLIGSGIQHSSSPSLHTEEGRSVGLQYTYELFDLDLVRGGSAALDSVLAEAERRGLNGVNVTYPCKQAVIPLLHGLSPEATQLQSVNTVLFQGGRRVGHNTDWWGFAEGFKRGLPQAPRARVALVGAGGAGAAVGYAVLKLGAQELRIFDRETQRSAELARRLQELFRDRTVTMVRDVADALDGADGLIHATPTGMTKLPGMPVSAQLLQPPLWVVDVVYVPLLTELLRVAELHGCQTLNGGGMAVFQAVMAFELFSGVAPDAQRMLRRFKVKHATAAA